jgi:hypothetical protein
VASVTRDWVERRSYGAMLMIPTLAVLGGLFVLNLKVQAES